MILFVTGRAAIAATTIIIRGVLGVLVSKAPLNISQLTEEAREICLKKDNNGRIKELENKDIRRIDEGKRCTVSSIRVTPSFLYNSQLKLIRCIYGDMISSL